MILLINPPWTFYPGSNYRPGGVPIHILTAASAFRDEGFDVRVIDCTAGNPPPREIAEGISQLGYSDDQLRELLAVYEPEMIGVSCLWTVQFGNAKRCLQLAKEIHPTVPVAIGSHHATVCPEECLKAGFDVVFMKELEGECKALVDEVNYHDQVIYENEEPCSDLDSFSFPAYDLIDMTGYLKSDVRYHGSPVTGGVPMITSRGCPFGCTFCTVHLSMGKKWRANSPEYVDRHLRYLKETYGVSHIYLEDDNLLINKERFSKIMDSFAFYGMTWDTPNGVRMDHLDDCYLEKMKASGCVELRISPESGSQKTLDGLGKELALNKLAPVAEKCKDLNLQLCAFWVIGIPGERVSDMKETLATAHLAQREWGVIPRISIATPFPGTGLYKQCVENGWLTDELTPMTLAPATRFKGLIKTDEFSPDDIAELLEDLPTWK